MLYSILLSFSSLKRFILINFEKEYLTFLKNKNEKVSKDNVFKIIQMISSDFRQLIKTLGFNDLCKLQKYQDFMNYANHEKVKMIKCIKVFQHF